MRKRDLNRLLKKLDKFYEDWANHGEEEPTGTEIRFMKRFGGSHATVMYVPQSENHLDMLRKLNKKDVLCDMGAGDLRFALQASQICKKVYAVEMNPITLADALKIIGYHLPPNLIAICCDWRWFPIPPDATKISCMVNGAELGSIPRFWFQKYLTNPFI